MRAASSLAAVFSPEDRDTESHLSYWSAVSGGEILPR